MDLHQEIERVISQPIKHIDSLGGGSFGQVYRVTLGDNKVVVAKVDKHRSAHLDCEGYMLEYLANNSKLPVPQVLYNSKELLIMSFIPGASRFSKRAQENAAELLAGLHKIHAPSFGLERDTLIGGLHQPNPWTDSWVDFFRMHRLIFMAHEGVCVQRLPSEIYGRIRKFCEHLDKWITEPVGASLIHGDAWAGNILAVDGCITGFIDPAIYYADPEIELAFATLFGTFNEPFFNRYQEIIPLQPGFFEERRDIYNLYPLLVHVRLFGGSYVQDVSSTLRRFGY